MKWLRIAGCLALLGFVPAMPAYAGKVIKAYDQTTGTEEPFSASGAWQVQWSSGDKTSGITVRIVDATSGAYVSEFDGISGAVRVDASGAFKVITTGARAGYKITISTLP